MIDVVSIKFKNRGKSYFFDPGELEVRSGDKVIVETSKGLEIADCCRGNHAVEETSVVQPLRPVLRIATADDLRIAKLNEQREKEAFEICQKKIAEHGLDMKLVDVECNFEGNKTMFFFTSDGRVDFRELVKDLAGIFRNSIELRQIGVRDEAKMIGGIGICGRPYCCSQFLDDFQPVSTKMAKIQSLSLNPTKISGSCGRLMCCLRYEQDAYEELIKKVPKQGAFVETKDGYGTAVQVNLLRQTVKVKLDDESDNNLRTYKAHELAAVPGGRPKDGETPPSVLQYVPVEEEPEEEEKDEWLIPMLIESESEQSKPEESHENGSRRNSNRRRRDRRSKSGAKQQEGGAEKTAPEKGAQSDKGEKPHGHRNDKTHKGEKKEKGEAAQQRNRKDAQGRGKATVKPVKLEGKSHGEGHRPAEKSAKVHREEAPRDTAKGTAKEGEKSRSSHRRRHYYGKRPKSGTPKEG